MFLLLSAPLWGCETVNSGDLAVTWRFNGHAGELGANPCGGLGADRIVIALEGEEPLTEVVACNTEDVDYPLFFVTLAADPTVWAYSRLMRSIPPGDYDLRVSFLTPDGIELAAPAPWEGRVTIKKTEITRVDLDFEVTTGSISTRWRIASGDADCTDVGASDIHLAVHHAGGAQVTETTVPCEQNGWTAAGLDPGTYEVHGELLDDQGVAITHTLIDTDLEVMAADQTSTRLEFDWADFDPPLTGELRFGLFWGDGQTVCSDASGLSNGPLQQSLLLTDTNLVAISGVAFPNPASQEDCAGLTAGQATDGATAGVCTDDEMIVCDLALGDYLLTARGLDASDLVCFETEFPVSVSLGPAETLDLVVEAQTDATQCWE